MREPLQQVHEILVEVGEQVIGCGCVPPERGPHPAGDQP